MSSIPASASVEGVSQRQAGFTASLDSFDLLDVIQIVNMSGKSITMLIDTGLEERGILCFQNGVLVWAEYGELRGEEAFFALATHKDGTVTQQHSDGPFGTNITQPLSRLIFQALQHRTEHVHEQQPPEQELGGTGFMPVIDLAFVLPPESVSPSAQILSDNIDDSPFVFTSEEIVSNDSTPTQKMSQVVSAEPAFLVPQEPFPPMPQFETPAVEQLDFSQSAQSGHPPLPPTKGSAAHPYRNKILLGLVIVTVISVVILAFAMGTPATVTEKPTPIPATQAYQKHTLTPASSLTPMVTPTPTSIPT